jgi:hypothetical protein
MATAKKETSAAGNLKTISIKGKDYVPVSERILAVTDVDHPEANKYTIQHWEIFELADRTFLRCHIGVRTGTYKKTAEGDEQEIVLPYSGTSGVSFVGGVVNTTSGFENAETSALGRALGFAGIGIIEGIASADEMVKVGAAKPYQPQGGGYGYSQPTTAPAPAPAPKPAAAVAKPATKPVLPPINKVEKPAETEPAVEIAPTEETIGEQQLTDIVNLMKEKGYDDKNKVNQILLNLADTTNLRKLTVTQAARLQEDVKNLSKTVLDSFFVED